MKTQKEMITELIKSIANGDQTTASYINGDNYKQHNLSSEDGIAGFGKVLAMLDNYPEPPMADPIRVLEDGDYVFSHSDYNFFGDKVGFDIFRFEDGLIVEHWDNLQVKPMHSNPSGRSMIDGATIVTDHDNTQINKLLVENFLKDVLLGEKPERFTEYFDGNNYIQHNPNIGDGLDGFSAAMAKMAEEKIELRFEKIHKILGEGNFVLSVCEGYYGEDGGSKTSFYDLFRIENGKIAEHWDVIEPIAPHTEWKNENGKFGF